MANKEKNMRQIQEIFRRKAQGESERSIMRNTGFSRGTIRDYLNIISICGYEPEQALSLTELELLHLIKQARKEIKPISTNRKEELNQQIEKLIKELNKTGVTRLLLWQEYIKVHPDGYSYTQFCYHFTQQKNIRQASMHFIYQPGECMMIDFAGDWLYYIDLDTGERIACQVLVIILPYSGYMYVQAMHSQKQEDLIHGLNNALIYFGGSPRNMKMDNMKSGVKKANRYDPDFTDLIKAFASHYGINCTTARVAKPKDKPHVEGGVLTSYRRIYAPLRNHTFHSLAELNYAIKNQLEAHHQMRFQNKSVTRMELFLEEKAFLKPLPDRQFEKYCTTKAKVQRNYHVQLGEDKHFYSVPFKLIGKTLKLIYTLDTIEIYDNLTRVAFHQRLSRSHGYTTIKEHMPANHLFYNEQRGYDADYFLNQSKKIGPFTLEFVTRLLHSKDFIEQSYNACLGVYRLAKKTPVDDFERSCERALLYPVVSYRQLENIIRKGLYKVPLNNAPQLQIKIPLHENIRGKQEYK
ncbi:MAG: IS21 family transposase [Bacteroidetes bacterium]|nr:IS21 family transposase [Bacteroidota bacterium]